jgi:hypothetical protein
MSLRPLLLVVLAALSACSDVYVIDLQASACLQKEECLPDEFAAQCTSQEACVDDYDETTSICYDLHCTYIPSAAVICQQDVEAQACADILNEIPSCAPEAVWESCDEAGLSTCLADLEGA